MANKYIRHGETYNGDGTTSAAATSNGGVGAWNNINILTGTTPAYGTLAAGDVVYIRSKDAAGADITVSQTATMVVGGTAATSSSRIKWILDSGTIWSGINGVLQFTKSASLSTQIRAYNTIECETQDKWQFVTTATSPFLQVMVEPTIGSILRRILIDWTAATSNEPGRILIAQDVLLDEVHVKVNRWGRDGLFTYAASYSAEWTAINMDVEVLQPAASVTHSLFAGTPGGIANIIGGQLRGAGANASMSLGLATGARGSGVRATGFRVPKTVNISSNGAASCAPLLDFFAADDEIGAMVGRPWGYMDSRLEVNTPYLNAQLPNTAASGWSWKVTPAGAAETTRMCAPVSAKHYSGSTSVLTFDLHLNITDTFEPNLNRNNLWAEFSYVDDSTGNRRTVTTRLSTTTALTAGATWSSSSYGILSLVSRKLSATTPTAVRGDSLVLVTLYGTRASGDASDIIFACPEVVAS